MDQNELYDMLGISPEEANATDASTIRVAEASTEADNRQWSDFVLSIDEFDAAQGERLLAESHRLGRTQISAEAAADFYAAWFHQQPQVNPDSTCVDANRQAFLAELLDTGEWRALHQQTKGNPFESQLAAEKLAVAFAKTFGQDKPQSASQPQNGAEAGGQEQEQGEQQAGAGLAAMLAAQSAVADVEQQMDELENIQKMSGGGGVGQEQGTLQQRNDHHLREVFERVQKDPTLRQIINLMGSYRRCAQEKQRTKTERGHHDIVGVEADNDVARLLPLELAKITDEDLELDAYRRFAMKSMDCWEKHSPAPRNRGPIVVCVDESGSMDGARNVHAKALAATMAWIAEHQKRHIALVGFTNTSSGRPLVLEPGNAGNRAKLIQWLTGYVGGGTDLRCPLDTVPFKLWDEIKGKKGKTDMIIITDGIVHVTDRMIGKFNTWKKDNQVTLNTLIIGEHSAGAFPKFSDKVYNMDQLGLANEGVQECLSV